MRLAANDKNQSAPSIPLQSLAVIPENKVNNVLLLQQGGGLYNQIFYSKELSIDSSIVEFISLLSQIKAASSSDDRMKIYQTFKTNESLKEILEKIKIEYEDLITFFKLIYHDYQFQNINLVVDDLNLTDNLNG